MSDWRSAVRAEEIRIRKAPVIEEEEIPPPFFTDEEIALAVEDVITGSTVEAVAARLKVHAGVVKNWVTFYEAKATMEKPKRKPKTFLSEVQLQALVADYEAGMKRVDLGRKYNLSPNGVDGALSRAGAAPKPKAEPKAAPGPKEERVNLYDVPHEREVWFEDDALKIMYTIGKKELTKLILDEWMGAR